MTVVDMSEPRFLMDRACEALEASEMCLTEKGIVLPEHRYVTACPPDLMCCDTLAVEPRDIVPIFTGQGSKRCVFQRILHFNVWIARCIVVFEEDGSLPPEGDCTTLACGTLSGDASTILEDRWALTMCLVRSLKELSQMKDPMPPWCCNEVAIEIASPIECLGSCAGTRFDLTLVVS